MHPSKRFKIVARFVASCGVVASALLVLNNVTIKSGLIEGACQTALLFVVNMVVALFARQLMKRALWPSPIKRAGAAAALVLFFAALLFTDYYLVADVVVGEDGTALEDALATLTAAVTWVGAYAVAWKPFMKREENRYISSGVSLALGFIAFMLYFKSLFSTVLFGGVGWKTSFIQFALACISFATAISAFTIQRDARTARNKSKLASEINQSGLVISAFEPRTDMEMAEEIISKGMLFDSEIHGPLRLWAHVHDAVCDAMERSTKLMAAYYRDTLVGVLFVREQGARKSHVAIRYRAFHKVFEFLESFINGGTTHSFDDVREELTASLECRLDAEIVLFATDSDFEGKGVGGRLLDSFEADHAGCAVYLAAYETLPTSFFEKRGYVLAAHSAYSDGSLDGEDGGACRILVKQIPEIRKEEGMGKSKTDIKLKPLKDSDRE